MINKNLSKFTIEGGVGGVVVAAGNTITEAVVLRTDWPTRSGE